MKVLVVDDDKLARKGLISIMDWGKYGFEVVGDVQNGRKALEFLKDNYAFPNVTLSTISILKKDA